MLEGRIFSSMIGNRGAAFTSESRRPSRGLFRRAPPSRTLASFHRCRVHAARDCRDDSSASRAHRFRRSPPPIPPVACLFRTATSESGGTSAKRFCRSLRFHVESALPRCRNESSHQIHGVVPEAQRCAAVLKDRSGQRGNLSQTFVAGIHRAAIDALEFALLVALWA